MKKIISIFSFLILLSACDNSQQVLDSLRFPEEGEGEVTYTKHVYPFLRIRCANTACHSAEYMAGNRNMSDFFSLFAQENLGLIIPGNPDGSVLMQVVNGKNPHLNNLKLIPVEPNHQQGIRRWINAGALNN